MNLFQSTAQNTLYTELETLTNSLTEFGLRPHDWILNESQDEEVMIQNIEEPTFCFVGTTSLKNGQKKWNSIQLYSL